MFDRILQDDQVEETTELFEEVLIVDILIDELYPAGSDFFLHKLIGQVDTQRIQVNTHAIAASLHEGNEHPTLSAANFQDVDAGTKKLCLFYKRKDIGPGVVNLLLEAYPLILVLFKCQYLIR